MSLGLKSIQHCAHVPKASVLIIAVPNCKTAAELEQAQQIHPATGLPIESGTHEEFLKAYELWKEHRRRRILFYRCDRPPERLDQNRSRTVCEGKGLL